MFLIRKPSLGLIHEFLGSQRKENFSYSEVGSTRGHLPSGYTVDRNRVCVGHGSKVFRRASELLNAWRMFDLGWVEIFPKGVTIEPGVTVTILARHLGFYSLNACRVIYVFREERRVGFAYGTLEDHAEQGEERFSIDWSGDDSVWYEILAFSRPKQWQAKIARPVSRMLQRRFARDSKAAMMKQR